MEEMFHNLFQNSKIGIFDVAIVDLVLLKTIAIKNNE